MRLEDVLPKLREGQAIRRTSTTHIKWIREIDPGEHPSVDGPDDTFRVMDGKLILEQLPPFTSEEDAGAAIKDLQAELKRQWQSYIKANTQWESASEEERAAEGYSPGAKPNYPSSHWKGLSIRKQKASRFKRLNKPFLAVLFSDGSIQPWVMNGTDLLALDWSIA